MYSRGLLEQAEQLARNPSAINRRTAVHSAYYAIFHAVKNMLKSWGFAFFEGGPDGGLDHWLIQQRLMNSGHPQLRPLGKKIRELHSRRKRADYDLHETEIERMDYVVDTVDVAKDLLITIEHHTAVGVERMVIGNIEAWDRKNEDRVP